MRAGSLLLLLAGVLLAGCNRPADQTPTGNVATDVAATLTAVPTFGPVATRPPSATAPPSATQQATATPLPTETPTLGPTPTATAPALPPGDPRTGLNLSAPDYSDDFSQSFKWFVGYEDNTVSLSQQNGKLIAVDKIADAYLTWSTTNVTAGNVYAEVTADVGACEGRDASGLSVRIGGDAYDRGYALELSCDGAYRVRKFINIDTPPKTLVDWTAAEAIVKGPNATNRIGFLADGNTLSVFANNTLLGQVEDNDLVAGTFGLFANAGVTDGLTVTFDDFALWYP